MQMQFNMEDLVDGQQSFLKPGAEQRFSGFVDPSAG
jgi:hypothetical protein